MKDSIIEAVCVDLRKRSKVGYKKYGKTLDRTDLTLLDWLNHAYEEALDTANYLKVIIKIIESNKKKRGKNGKGRSSKKTV